VESTYLENTYPDKEQNGREERVQESAMIREQSSATDPQQSEYTTTIMQLTINPCKTPEGRPTGHVLPNAETAGCISSYLTCLNDISWMGMLAGCVSSSLNVAKYHLGKVIYL